MRLARNQAKQTCTMYTNQTYKAKWTTKTNGHIQNIHHDLFILFDACSTQQQQSQQNAKNA